MLKFQDRTWGNFCSNGLLVGLSSEELIMGCYSVLQEMIGLILRRDFRSQKFKILLKIKSLLLKHAVTI